MRCGGYSNTNPRQNRHSYAARIPDNLQKNAKPFYFALPKYQVINWMGESGIRLAPENVKEAGSYECVAWLTRGQFRKFWNKVVA